MLYGKFTLFDLSRKLKGMFYSSHSIKPTSTTVTAPAATPVERPDSLSHGRLLPRGIRNNNPGNIERTSVRWKGMAVDQSGDARFIVFTAPEWGIRAIARILLGDWREGQNTIASLIHEWAPPVENNTDAYVRAVGKACGVDPYEPCDIPALLPKIIAAIIKHENGIQPYSADLIQLGIDLERSA